MAHQPKDYSSESGTLIFPWHLRLLFKLRDLLPSAIREDGSIARRLCESQPKSPAQPDPARGVASHDTVINQETGVWVRIFTPATSSVHINHGAPAQPMPIIFYFHGGGFALCSADTTEHHSFCSALCTNCQALVISVNYRRSPEHRYPIAYEDCFSALTWLQAQGKDHIPSGADLSRCFLMGDSAGGNIVHHVGCMAAVQDLNPVRLIGNVLLFPFFGGENRTPSELRLANAPMLDLKSTDWMWRDFLPTGANRDHEAANVFGPNAPDISSLPLPPSMVAVGEYDLLKDRQIRYVEKLKKIGKEVQLLYYEGGVHAFHVFPSLKPAVQLLADIQVFIHARCNADENGSAAMSSL